MAPRLGKMFLCLLLVGGVGRAEDPVLSRRDYAIDAIDPGIRLSVREVIAGEAVRLPEERIVVFVHGFGLPSRPAFDVADRETSWAEWMARRGYAVYLFDIRSCGWSTRERAMTEAPDRNPGVARAYLAVRDVGAVVDHVRAKHGVARVALVGWSWGGTLAGWFASVQPEKVHRLVLVAAVYSGRQEVKPFEPPGAFLLFPAAAAVLKERFAKVYPLPAGEPPRKDSLIEALAVEIQASDPTSGTRNPPTYRVPAGAAEDIHYMRVGRPIFHASSIYAPTLVVTAAADTLVPAEHGEALMRDLTHAAVRKSVVIPGATHMLAFDPRRLEAFAAVESFLREPMPAVPAARP